MNKLGILGLGSYSTLHYVKSLNLEYQKEKGGYSTAPFVLLNVDFDSINPNLPNQFDEVIKNIRGPLKEMESFGVKHLLVPNITLHETLDKIINEFQFELIHPLPLIIEELKREKVEKVVILGTKYTMNSSYLNRFLKNNSIEVLKQKESIENQIDEIRRKTYDGKDCIEEFEGLISSFPKSTALVIGCTELSILNQKSLNNKIFDLASTQIIRAKNLLLG